MDQRERNRQLRKAERHLIEVKGGGDIRVVLAYPNRYWLAMSNLGFQTVYRLLHAEDRFCVERAYLPENLDEETVTFENERRLRESEILAISVSFETDYPFVLKLLEEAGVDLERKAVGSDLSSRPLILGGGASLTLNPEPLAEYFDAIVLGEAEEVLREIAECYRSCRDREASFDELLLALAQLSGVYVPRFYAASYNNDNTIQAFHADPRVPARPIRRVVKDISAYPTYTAIQTPETEFKSMFMTETGRGCEVGCKFCVAGYMYRPVRKRSEASIRESLKIGLESSESVGFVGAAVSSHPKIAELASEVAASGKRAALSSIMSQRVTPELAESLSESEYKTVALAPEAGSEELRFRIGKRVCDEQIIEGVATLAKNGIRNFKLYFIVGLPSEQPEDVEAIGNLVARAQARAYEAASSMDDFRVTPRLILSVNPFIPKAWTPFQRHCFLDSKQLKRKLQIVSNAVNRLPNVSMKYESPRESYFQALLSRGDRRAGELLAYAHRAGYDWRWLVKHAAEQVCEQVPPASFYVERVIAAEERLPWEIVDLQIKRELLEREYQRTFDADVGPAIQKARARVALSQVMNCGDAAVVEEVGCQ